MYNKFYSDFGQTLISNYFKIVFQKWWSPLIMIEFVTWIHSSWPKYKVKFGSWYIKWKVWTPSNSHNFYSKFGQAFICNFFQKGVSENTSYYKS